MLQTATLINKIRRKFKERVISREHWTQCSCYRESGKKKKTKKKHNTVILALSWLIAHRGHRFQQGNIPLGKKLQVLLSDIMGSNELLGEGMT